MQSTQNTYHIENVVHERYRGFVTWIGRSVKHHEYKLD